MGGRSPDRLSRWEILGAWLRVWTPPREAVVPPVPWPKVAAGGALVLVAAVVAVVALLNTESDRDAAQQRAARDAAARHAAFLAGVDRRQRPQTGTGPPDPGPGAAPAARRRTRRALVDTARVRIEVVVREQTPKRIRGVNCEPFPRRLDAPPPTTDLAFASAAYDCVAVTSRFATGIIGEPLRLVVHFDTGRFAWCRIVPLGDRDRLSHPLPGACRV